MSRRDEILTALATAVDGMDEAGAVRAAQEALATGIDAYDAITQGLSRGMEIVSGKYEKGVYFVPEILLCADAMYAAIDVLRPHLKAEEGKGRSPVIIGVIEVPVHDLGNDVAVTKFLQKAREVKAGIIAISTLMTTTRPGMGRLIAALKQAGLRDSFKVMIGGGAVSAHFAQEIGADGYGANAMEAVRIATALEEVRK